MNEKKYRPAMYDFEVGQKVKIVHSEKSDPESTEYHFAGEIGEIVECISSNKFNDEFHYVVKFDNCEFCGSGTCLKFWESELDFPDSE